MPNASKKVLYSLNFLCCFLFLCHHWSFGQTLNLPLRSAGINHFGNRIYCYGIEQKHNKAFFTIYRLNDQFLKSDSLSFALNQKETLAQSSCWSDSLHGIFNVYVPEGQEKGFSVFRFNRNFELLDRASGIEPGRLHPLAGFDNSLHYDGNFVYAIKTKRDSSGLQFFLNKFRLKENLKAFEYEPVWQFPFERKHIRYARVIYSDKDYVILYVMIADGEKSGQWILRLNARNGFLLRGSKLNDKGEEQTYLYGSSFYSKNQKSLILLGHKFSSQHYKPGSETLSAVSPTVAGIYLLELDSLGEKINKQELKWPITEAKIPGKKKPGTYLLQFSRILEKSSGYFSVQFDVYKGLPGSVCYLYGNSLNFNFKRDGDAFAVDKASIFTDVQIDSYVFSPDKLDMNGKICADSGLSLPRLLSRNASLPVKSYFGLDSLGQPMWILSKSLVKKGSVQFHYLKAGKKSYELRLIEELPKSKNPYLLIVNSEKAILSRQESESEFRLKTLRLR